MTTVHLPSGLKIRATGEPRPNLADYCPQRQEHNHPGKPAKAYVATTHAPCGLQVVWVKRHG